MGVTQFTSARDLLRRFDVDQHPGEVCEAIASAIHRIAPYRRCAVLTIDPDTMLPSGGLVEGFSAADCAPFWDNELLDPDFNKFTDLARRHDPIATLVETVEGDLGRSPRYNKLYAQAGVSDELRIAFVAGTSCLAVGVFLLCDGEEFSAEQLSEVRALLPLASGLLRQAQSRLVYGLGGQSPVVVTFDARGKVTSMTAGARQTLEDLRVNDEVDFPGVLEAVKAKARSTPRPASVTTRLRGRSGQLLRVHVSPTEDGSGSVVVTVEAAPPDDFAMAMLRSYDLTPRETQIAVLLCRGLSAKEIAAEMMISVHTVRDHVKAIYEKADVRSRGELMAGLFFNHVLHRFETGVVHRAAPAGD